jgi:hypothetical protein
MTYRDTMRLVEEKHAVVCVTTNLGDAWLVTHLIDDQSVEHLVPVDGVQKCHKLLCEHFLGRDLHKS